MQTVTVIRGSNGVVLWVPRRTGPDEISWQCLRDNVRIVVPDTIQGLEAFLVNVSQHSTQLVGTIQQVVQIQV